MWVGNIKNNSISRSSKKILLYVMAVVIVLLSSAVTKADDLFCIGPITQPSPEMREMPKIESLKNAYKLTLMQTDTITNIQKGIQICKDYIKNHPGDNDIVSKISAYIIMSEAYFQLGDYQENDAEKLKSYTQGVDASQKVIDIIPDRWDGWAWWAINTGRISEVKGVLKSLFLLEPFKKHIFKAESLAPNSPFILDTIGIMYRQIPWIAGGDNKKSEEFLRKALSIDPHFTLARLDLAITLLEEGKKAESEKELNAVINDNNSTWMAHYLLWERPKAEALLKNMDNYKPLLDKWHLMF